MMFDPEQTPIIGRNLVRRFRITLDHGRQAILEP
jgi:hypothetical protein